MKRMNRNKTILMLAMVVLILAGAVGGTLAYLTTQTNPVLNTFNPSKVTCAVEEPGWTDGSTTKQNVSIKNTGDVNAYIRAAVVANWCDAEGNIIAPHEVDLDGKMGAGWVKDGEYYYYEPSAPSDPFVEPGHNTNNLINEYPAVRPEGVPEGAHLEMTIISQAVQAEGLIGVTNSHEAFAYVTSHNPGSTGSGN